jgi:hypothetical protein
MALSLATVGGKITAAFINAIVAQVNAIGLTWITPTVAAGSGTFTASTTTGKVTLTAVGTSFTLSGFPTTYNRHVITIDGTTSLAGVLTAQFTDSAGTTVAITAYDTQYTYSDGTASLSSTQLLNNASMKVNHYAAQTRRRITFDLSQLAVVTPTIGDFKATETLVAGAAQTTVSGSTYHRTSAAYAGVKFSISAGTFTGIAYVEVGEPA